MAEDGLTDYERLRQENIRRNEAMLVPVPRKADELSAAIQAIQAAKPKRGRPRKTPEHPPTMAEDGLNLNAYERLRQENIRRNEAILGPIRRKAAELSAATRPAKPKRPNPKPKAQPTSPVRSSLRSRGISPAADLPPVPPSTRLSPSLASSILAASSPPPENALAEDFDAGKELVLKPAHVRRVVTSSALSLRVLPLVGRTVVAAGDRLGNIGFWDVDGAPRCSREHGALHRYSPHKSPVSAIVAHPAAPHKVYSSSYRGEICLMDFEEENFNMVHLWKCPIFSLCQAPDSVRCLYFGDESGGLTLFDECVGKVLTTWDVHGDTIESIDFHPENKHMLATSSTDGSACIWDVRNMKKNQPDSLKVFKLNDSAQSAYFSPSGRMLAVTSSSRCGTVQVFSVDDFEKSHTVEYNNKTDSWPYTFKVIWGWNDTDLYIGNMRKGIDIISVDVNDSGLSAQNSSCLRSQHMQSVPCQFSVNPYNVGYLACLDSSGHVFLWTRA